MTLYCVVDCQPIPPERVAKKAVTCSQECADEYRRQRRQERAEKKCRLCGRPFRQRRSPAGVLHEHNGMVESVRVQIPVSGVDGEFSASGVSAALTSERQEQSTTKAIVVLCGNCGKPSKLCNTKNFTASVTLENKVETLLTVGAELPVYSRPQVDTQGNSQSYAQAVEMSENEVMG